MVFSYRKAIYQIEEKYEEVVINTYNLSLEFCFLETLKKSLYSLVYK